MQWIAVALALSSAVCLALGTQTQSVAVTGHTEGPLTPRGLWPLVRNLRWLSGLALLGLGTVLYVAALSLAT
ncbi:hypothetical protein K1Y78_63205, partial [Streptomyces sp. tea 10]|nr:hypothetical protein [Streptomyces sp. tea 10]